MKTKNLFNYLLILISMCIINLNASAQVQWVLDTVISTVANSSGIAITPDNSKIVVTNKSASGAVKIISTSNYSIKSVSYAADGYPNGVDITADGKTAVVNTMHHTFAVDLSSNSLNGNFAAPCVGTTLYGVAVSGSTAYYPDLSSGCTQDGLRSTNAALPSSSLSYTQINTSGVLYGIAIKGSSAIISAFNAAPVNFDLSSSTYQSISGMSGSYGLATLHKTNEALIFDGDSIKRVSLTTNKVTKTIAYLSFNTSFQNIAITADDKYAFVIGAFEKLVISLADNSVIQTFTAGATNVACTSDGSKFYVTDSYNGTVRVYKKASNTEIENINSDVYHTTVYPNPTSGILTINSSEKINAIEIYNILGEKISGTPIPLLNNAAVDLSSQSKGIYFVKIYNGSKIRTEKIIVQ